MEPRITRAFLFDSYNHDLCVRQHRESLEDLAIEIAAAAVGACGTAWVAARRRPEPTGEDSLPGSFTARRTARPAKKRCQDIDHQEVERRRQFAHANRRRECICVPAAGLRWWEPGISPCGRRGQQCGCSRSREPGLGTVWEAWRGSSEWGTEGAGAKGAFQPAVVLSEARPHAAALHEGADSSLAAASPQLGVVVDVAFVCDGALATVPAAWLRPPSAEVPFRDLDEFGVSACLCSLRSQLSDQVGDLRAHDDGRGSTASKPLPGVNEKHFAQRYRYFSRFDNGICVDFEGWHSMSPEAIADHVAARVSRSLVSARVGGRQRVIFDAFCGCGGNAIAFARAGLFVVAVDIDPSKVACAQRNAAVYGVSDRIEFIAGDSAAVMAGIVRSRSGPARGAARSFFDTVCLAPPWGGPDYLAARVFDLEAHLCCPLSGSGWLAAARTLSDNVVMLLPRSVLPDQLALIAAGGPVEVEDVALNYKIKMKVAYFGATLIARCL